MARYEHVIHIDAPPPAVWAVMVDVERWPEWTRSIRRVELLEPGLLRPGSAARVAVRGLPASTWRVTEMTDARSFTWETRQPGTHAVAGHLIEADGAASRVTLTSTITGPGSFVLRPFVAALTRRNLRLEAEGLKRCCEATGSPG